MGRHAPKSCLRNADLRLLNGRLKLGGLATANVMADAPNSDRHLLAWLDGHQSIRPATVTPVRRAIEDQVDRAAGRVPIDVWLESPGGDAHSAFALALMLRDAGSHVRMVVPDYAKSAATLLALAGDEIYLAPGAQLGPLDAQMPEEGSLVGQMSALNIARASDDVARNAVNIALEGGADLLELTGLSRAKTMEVMLQFSASFSEPLVRQLDPRIVHDAKQMLKVTVQYAERLLNMTGCPNASRIAKAMVENYPTHGYMIDFNEAEALGLPVFPMSDYEFIEPARKLHRAAEDGRTLIEFGPIADMIPAAETNEEVSETTEGGDPEDEQPLSEGDHDGQASHGNGAKAGAKTS